MPRQTRPAAVYTADRRLFLDASGKVVEAGDPARKSLLVPAGGTLPMQRAIDLGLAQAEAEPETKAQSAPPATKQIKAPPENKATS